MFYYYYCIYIYILKAVSTDMEHSVGRCFMHPWGFGFKLALPLSTLVVGATALHLTRVATCGCVFSGARCHLLRRMRSSTTT